MAPNMHARHPRTPAVRPASPRYPSLRRASVGLLAGLLPVSALADTGDTDPADSATPGEVREDQAWEAISDLLLGYADATQGEPVQLMRKGEPWHSARAFRAVGGTRSVFVALEASLSGVDEMLADPTGWAAEHSCLLLEVEGECRRAACGEDLDPAVEARACGVVGVFPYGPHSSAKDDTLWLYDGAVEGFIAWGQAHDMLYGWQLAGCGCATSEGPARDPWYAVMAVVLGLAFLVRRRDP